MPFNDSKVWRSPPRRIIVTQGLAGLHLKLIVKQYEPLPEDQDSYSWVDSRNGQPGQLTLPRFAVADIQDAQGELDRYIQAHMVPYIESKIGPHEFIAWRTFQMALKLSQTEGVSRPCLLPSDET